MKITRIVLLLAGFSAMAYVAFAADQMKNTETVIASSDIAVSGAQSYSFTFYIGDNISSIVNPLKSLSFIASGVYTSSADQTVSFMIDGDLATIKTFTLPNSNGIPTPFNLEYHDSSNRINPSSAGSYSHTLNFDSGSVMIYGLGITMSEAHQYAPPACADGTTANQKIKTTEVMVADSNSAVSSIQVYPVTFYIGDSLVGVTNPVKSVFFTISGVYTGGGSVTLDINGSGSKTFSLPSVGATPTPFGVAYRDATNVINPSSAGSYSYTLNLNPIGVVVYGLGIKLTETHQYAPPACGGFPVYGDLTSSVFDSTGSADGAAYNSVLWNGVLGGAGADQGKVLFQFAAADAPSGPWTFLGGDTCASDNWFDPGASATPIELKGTGLNAPVCTAAWNNKRYFRYKIRICSNDCVTAGAFTPIVNGVVVNWAP